MNNRSINNFVSRCSNHIVSPAFTIVEILIVVAIIGILSTMAIPQFFKARMATKTNICVNNLRQIDAAIDRWVFEHDYPEGTTLGSIQEEEMYSYITGGKPLCPAGGTYTIGVIGTHPQVTCTVEGHVIQNE